MILSPVIRQRFLDANGNPLAGGKLYSYAAGTSTPQATYSDQAGTPNTNPVILNANGEANVWVDPSLNYKFMLADSSDVTQWTVDNVNLNITSAQIPSNAVTTVKINDGAVTQAKIANLAVGVGQIADSAVTTAKLNDGAVTTPKLADASVSTAKLIDGSVTKAKMAAVGQVVSSSCGNFTTSSTAYVDVTNLNVTIPTTGRGVKLKLQPSGSFIASFQSLSSGTGLQIALLRDGVTIASIILTGTITMPGTWDYEDYGASAASHTYKIQASSTNGASVALNNVVLVAREL
jgi:hypothetical protein